LPEDGEFTGKEMQGLLSYLKAGGSVNWLAGALSSWGNTESNVDF